MLLGTAVSLLIVLYHAHTGYITFYNYNRKLYWSPDESEGGSDSSSAASPPARDKSDADVEGGGVEGGPGTVASKHD